VQPLIRAFATFDTYTSNRLVDEALGGHSIETVCVGLLQPALNRVSDLWAHREMTIPEEHYAINFVRGRLFSIFATTPERYDGPLAIVTCGPREMHDIVALMLATFWRRAGLRVVFLGQDMDGEALVQDVALRRPRLVCVCIMASQRVRALARIAKAIRGLTAPTPIFTYSGAVFQRNPELQRKVSGVYLGDDPASATWHAMRLLGVDPATLSASPPEPSTTAPAGHAG
jgi:methanogenic corrinoid protein MtbC1